MADLPPSTWVRRWVRLIPRGEVLDLACGAGRHTRLLAAMGYPVLAVDRDADALTAIAGPDVRTLAVDLEVGPWPLAGRQFAGVVVTNYLHRALFAPILEAIAPGGVLLYETFAAGNERYGRPCNPAFLLRQGELLETFGTRLCVTAFEQGWVGLPRPAIIQRLCARRAVDLDTKLEP